jgi:VIT1/CCC1 family predicted Fe2+/Mn2+ transporter
MEKEVILRHAERHRSHHTNWLRAAVLGANDGIISTASLIIGVAAANTTHETILLTGVAGLIAGAMSMAAGEYVSVSSQADIESADLSKERLELASDHENELKELTNIYIARGLKADLAYHVAIQLTEHDALGAHARDELGITDMMSAQPLQAALASGLAFTIGALLPLLIILCSPLNQAIIMVSITSLLSLAILGGVAAKVGGANVYIGMARVTFWGVLAMGATALIGNLFGVMAA